MFPCSCILKKLEFSREIFEKNSRVSNSMTIRQLGDESFHVDGRTDGQTDMTKLRVAFHNFVTAPKKHSVNIS